MLKVSAVYLEKQKSFIPEKIIFLAVVSKHAKIIPKDPKSRPNFQWKFWYYYVAHQISSFCKHFTVSEHFSVHRDSKMFAKIGDLTRNILSSEKNLPLKDSKETKNRKEDVDLVVRNFELNATWFFFEFIATRTLWGAICYFWELLSSKHYCVMCLMEHKWLWGSDNPYVQNIQP